KDAAGIQMSVFQKAFTLAAPANPPHVVNAVAQGSPSSLTGVRLSFDHVIDASTFTTADVPLTGPDGKAVAIAGVKPAAGYSTGNVWDVTFAAQTKGGTYSLKAGPAIADAAGVQMASAYAKAFTVTQAPPPTPTTSSTTPRATAYW